MTEDELAKVLRHMVDTHGESPPSPAWKRVQARRTEVRHRRLQRRAVIGLLAAAASLALIAGGVRVHRHADHLPPEVAMTTASATVIHRHLAQSDTMIGAFRSAVASGTWDDRLTTRARDLELATRRIQGGRIPADSTLAGLLTDLDLVFTEIVGYGDLSAHRDTESEMIEYSIAVRQVVPRLRTASADAAAHANPKSGFEP